MVNAKVQQHVDIQFCVRSGMDRGECIARIHALHGPQALSASSIHRWFAKFQNGVQQVQDAPRIG